MENAQKSNDTHSETSPVYEGHAKPFPHSSNPLYLNSLLDHIDRASESLHRHRSRYRNGRVRSNLSHVGYSTRRCAGGLSLRIPGSLDLQGAFDLFDKVRRQCATYDRQYSRTAPVRLCLLGPSSPHP
jgi:hypothetical protein